MVAQGGSVARRIDRRTCPYEIRRRTQSCTASIDVEVRKPRDQGICKTERGDWKGRRAACALNRLRKNSFGLSFRGGRRGDRRAISHWAENTQSEIPRCALNDNLKGLLGGLSGAQRVRPASAQN